MLQPGEWGFFEIGVGEGEDRGRGWGRGRGLVRLDRGLAMLMSGVRLGCLFWASAEEEEGEEGGIWAGWEVRLFAAFCRWRRDFLGPRAWGAGVGFGREKDRDSEGVGGGVDAMGWVEISCLFKMVICCV